MHFRIMLWKSKIIIIKIQTYLLYIYLVLNVVFIPRYIVEAVQDDISSKTIRKWLRNAVQCTVYTYFNSFNRPLCFNASAVYNMYIYKWASSLKVAGVPYKGIPILSLQNLIQVCRKQFANYLCKQNSRAENTRN